MDSSQSQKKTLLLRSLFIAGGLTGFKLVVFGVTNSMAILASAVDSFMDLVVSLVNFMLARSAARPADHHHPYGHGKIESLAGMLQSLVIGAVSLGVAGMSIRRFLQPEDIHQPLAGIVVTVIALALNLWHVKNLRASMVSTGSQVMATEYLHYASDILVYLGVFASFVLFKTTGALFWDPLISLLIVVYLVKNIAAVFDASLGELLDKQLPDPLLKELDQLIRRYHPQVVDYHDLRTRKVGPTKFIEFHVEIRGVEKFNEAHDLTEGLIARIRDKHPGAIVTVHYDPEGGI